MYYFVIIAIVTGIMIWDISTAHAVYTPLIDVGFFDGVSADVMAGASGWLGVAVAVAGALLILRVLTR